MNKKIKAILIFGFFLILTIIASLPLLKPGFFTSHDGLVHLINLAEFSRMLKSGQFPVRWAADLDFGYGNPLFNFYSPLLYYLSYPLTIIFGYIVSLKAVVILMLFLSGLFTYLLAKNFWGESGGLISAVAYIFLPYRFLDLYVRGAFPEYLALSLIPFTFWAFYKLLKNGKKYHFILASFSLAMLVLAHNFIAFISIPVLALFITTISFSNKSWKLLLKTGLAFILGFGATLFFLLPVLTERQFLFTITQMNIFQPWMHYLNLSKLWDCQWGFSVLAGGNMCFQLGKAHLLLSLGSLLLFTSLKSKQRVILAFFLVMTLGAAFMTMPYSDLLWRNINFLTYGQFPWRFLTLAGWGLAISAGSSSLFFNDTKIKKIFTALAITVIIILNLSFLKPHSYLPDLKDESFSSETNLNRAFVGRTDEQGGLYFRETTPLWVKSPPSDVPTSKIEADNATISNEVFSPTNYSFSIDVKSDTQVTINTFFFPGWKILLDEKEVEIKIAENGSMNFTVAPGQHQVKVLFTNTQPRKIGEIGSLVSLVAILILGVLL
jgi:uncharacterized membrane protein